MRDGKLSLAGGREHRRRGDKERSHVSDYTRVYTFRVDRHNSEGIPRSHLTVALKDRRQVLEARRFDTCMLCRRHRVNDSGLCEVCYSTLEGEEFKLACRWISGVGP